MHLHRRQQDRGAEPHSELSSRCCIWLVMARQDRISLTGEPICHMKRPSAHRNGLTLLASFHDENEGM